MNQRKYKRIYYNRNLYTSKLMLRITTYLKELT